MDGPAGEYCAGMAVESRVITQERLVADLAALGLESGDTVMVHASIKAIGRLAGGPDIVHRAVMAAVGPEGTMLMVVGWADDLYGIADLPAAEQALFLAALPPYDPLTSRADRETGLLAECFRSWPGVRRSRSPTGSFAACGRQAEWLLAGQTLDHYFGPESPLDRLCRAGGRVLLLGSQPENVTLLHFAEYLAQLPDKRSVRYPEIVRIEGERRVVEVTALDNSRGIVDWPEDYFATITTAYIAARGLAPRPVGAAPSFLLDADDLARFGADWMERNFAQARTS
jgi:aminoglycoside 3-N-acetyltransferase